MPLLPASCCRSVESTDVVVEDYPLVLYDTKRKLGVEATMYYSCPDLIARFSLSSLKP